MKKLALIALAALATAHAAPTRTATEGYVDRTVAAATNGLATADDVESKADKATTLEGYGITNAATKIELDVVDQRAADALDNHEGNTNNPHKVTAAQVGALSLEGGTLTGDLAVGEEHTASRRLTIAADNGANGITLQGGTSYGSGSSLTIGGSSDNGGTLTVQGGGNSGGIIIVTGSGASIRKDGKEVATEEQLNAKADATNVYTKAAIDAKVENSVLPTNPTFSNAVLAVGLNIDTNSVAVMNEIAETFGGFPIGGTATTVGGLLAALAAAVAWLRKKKIDKLTVTGMSKEVTADGGVAKLDDFFTNSNSLLNGRLAYSRNATGLKDRAFNTLSFDGTEFNLSAALEAVTPTASGQPRDLLIVATATAATTIGYTAGTIKGDKPTIDGAGTWLITLTEYASGVWYCRQIKMEDAA